MAMWSKKELHMMGTLIDISIDHPEANQILEETADQLAKYEKRYSANDPDSELMQITKNAGQKPVAVSPDLFELIRLGKLHSLPDDSFLNISIGVLTKAWRIGFKDARVPTEIEIKRLLQVTNPAQIILDEASQTVYLAEGMSIDLGALAKGYIADLIVDQLKAKGVAAGMINLGGNVLAFGTSPNSQRDKWHIGIRTPGASRETYQAIVKIKDRSVVTSGIYERSLTVGNQTYHHIFNPKTGYPVDTQILSLTIISKQSIEGEIWTTRLFGHSPTIIIEKINQIDGVEGIVITSDETLYSSGMEQYL